MPFPIMLHSLKKGNGHLTLLTRLWSYCKRKAHLSQFSLLRKEGLVAKVLGLEERNESWLHIDFACGHSTIT